MGCEAAAQQLGRALIGAVTFVLLIACANVANLLMARAVARGREIALRMVSRRPRPIVRSSCSSRVSCWVCWVALRVCCWPWRSFDGSSSRSRRSRSRYWIDWSMDATSFMTCSRFPCSPVCCSASRPPCRWRRSTAVQGLRESGRQASASGRSRSLTGALVVAEMSLTIALMVGAGLFRRSLMTLEQVNVGFRTENLLTMTVPLDERKLPDPAVFVSVRGAPRIGARDRRVHLRPRSRDLVSGRRYLKLSDRDLVNGDGAYPIVATVSVSPGYFKALGLTMARGREFAPTDGGGEAERAVDRQPAIRAQLQDWPGDDPIGKRIRLGPAPWATVIGVSPTIVETSLHRDVEALVYEPPRQT